MFKRKHFGYIGLAGLGLVLLAVLAPPLTAQGVTQGYVTDKQVQKGMIVRLVSGKQTKIEPLEQGESSDMLGVVVGVNDSPIALSDSTAALQVYVATIGQYDVLVSDQNGPIPNGSLVTISSIGGVGMKTDGNEQMVLGKATTAFDPATSSIGTAKLKKGAGTQLVRLGRVKVDISVAHNPQYQSENIGGVPQFLSRAAQTVSKRQVGAMRIYASLVVLVICAIVAGVILYAGVRSGMVSIGRNPLAKKAIIRNLLQVMLMALIVFVIGLIAVYLLLKL